MLSVIDDAPQLTESEIRRFRDAAVWIEGLEPGADAVHRDVRSFSPLWLLSRRRATALAAARIASLAVNCYRCDTPVPDSSRFCQACGADVSGGAAGSAVAIERDPELEERLAAELEGEFVIERLLGRGGMGTVFLARDLHLHRKVAIKVLPPELTYGPGTVERFKREARTAATLDHSHIVPIYRISSTGKLVWFAMKYIEGETLATVLERERTLPPDRAAAILTRVAEALGFAHQHGVIHRDVKPANVMLDHRGWVTVTDFGIAKAVDSNSLTGSGALIGTPFYMSPEQCAGKRTITGATDQYSLGVMAYQMLSGRLPFVGESTVDIIKQQCFDQPPPLGTLLPQLPPRLIAAVERALNKEPERRFASVTDFARAIAGSIQGEPPTVPMRARRRAPEGQRWRLASWVAVGGILVVATIAGLLLRQQGKGALETADPTAPAPPPVSQAQPGDSVASIEIGGAPGALEEGEQVILKATVRSAQGDTMSSPTVDWRTTDSAVALVSEDGSVRGVRSGTATITASSGNQRTTVTITVKPAAVASLRVMPRAGTIRPGETLGLRMELRDSRGRLLTGRAISWTSSDPNIASVGPSGTVMGVAPGTARITATTDRVRSVPITVTVAQPAPAILRVLIQPWAAVSIDGRSLGERVRVEDTVPAGIPHQLRFERDGYVSLDTIVTLQPGRSTLMTITLRRRNP